MLNLLSITAFCLLALFWVQGRPEANPLTAEPWIGSFGGERVEFQAGGLHFSSRVLTLEPGKSATITVPVPTEAFALIVRTIIATDAPSQNLSYEVRLNGELIGLRDMPTEGVGRRSQFIRVSPSSYNLGKQADVTVKNMASTPLLLEGIVCLPNYLKLLEAQPSTDDFTLAFLLNSARAGHPDLARLQTLKPVQGVQVALSSEIPYALSNRDYINQRISGFRDACNELGWPAVPILISWWAGTPSEIRENLEFQQICYSETDDFDEGQPLRDLLGDKWDIRYGLTIPNIWSNTPWQTMNNPELNELRRSRLADAMPTVLQALGEKAVAYITENEPMYWAGAFPDQSYPVKRENLLADFNPHTVEAAAHDGITLDPTDGLSMQERWWLFHNLRLYLEQTSKWIRDNGAGAPVYTHALLEDHFPMKNSRLARPALELALASDFPAGVEMLWDTSWDKLLRLRELKQWACVNREEGDGRPVSHHTAMALAVYAAGGDMLNSYNWQSIHPPESSLDYFQQFMNRLPEFISDAAGSPQAELVRRVDRLSWPSRADDACPWGSLLKVKLSNPHSTPIRAELRVRDSQAGRIVGFATADIPAHYSGWVDFHLDSLTDSPQHRRLTFNLRSTAEVDISMAGAAIPQYQWILQAWQERVRSRILLQLAEN